MTQHSSCSWINTQPTPPTSRDVEASGVRKRTVWQIVVGDPRDAFRQFAVGLDQLLHRPPGIGIGNIKSNRHWIVVQRAYPLVQFREIPLRTEGASTVSSGLKVI